jgi:pyrroloquinoline-quinone synthase
MNAQEFQRELDSRIARYDLLCHPFYQAWSKGQLTREDLRSYAAQYYRHVSAFPEYLKILEDRLRYISVDTGDLSSVVAQNRAEENGWGSLDGRSHAELWLDFAEGMGADRAAAASTQSVPEVEALTESFREIAREGSPAEALATFYAYESQVPRVAFEKERGLRNLYGADSKTCTYFTVHQTADVLHAQTWSDQLQITAATEEDQHKALAAAERAAQALWNALDGIDRERLARAA